MKNALLTSFQRSHDLPCPAFSAAVYQPDGYDYPKADWADIRDASGKWIRPREFLGLPDPLKGYQLALEFIYRDRADQIREWLSRQIGTFALCCWCPWDRAAQRQLVQHGSFVCHTAVIGLVLERDHGVRVWYDSDRQRMKVLPL